MTVRSVPKGLAPLLEVLELEQPRLLTTAQLKQWSTVAGIQWPVDVVVRRLRERGWLLDMATRGVWEFAPAARAGTFGSGDPFIELRATLARDPAAPYGVAADSAAYLLGLASRRPDAEVIGAPPAVRPPKALRNLRCVHWSPASPTENRDGLPVWSSVTLLAFMAARSSLYHDWPNVGEWLARATTAATADDLRRELTGHSRPAWARAAYLLAAGGQAERAKRLLAYAPKGTGPYYLGPRNRPGRHQKAFDVIDSSGMEIVA
jgi:hypothetical protein